jgi:hypothetical protein
MASTVNSNVGGVDTVAQDGGHGGGGSGTTDHAALSNRSASAQHPMSAITGLVAALDGKAPVSASEVPGEITTATDTIDADTDANVIKLTYTAGPITITLAAGITGSKTFYWAANAGTPTFVCGSGVTVDGADDNIVGSSGRGSITFVRTAADTFDAIGSVGELTFSAISDGEEAVQDVVGGMAVASGGSYNDGAGTVSWGGGVALDTLLTAEVQNADTDRIVLTFSDDLTGTPPSGAGGFTLSSDGASITVTGVTFPGGAVAHLATSRAVEFGEALTNLTYTPPGSDPLATAAGEIAAFTGVAVTNSVEEPATPVEYVLGDNAGDLAGVTRMSSLQMSGDTNDADGFGHATLSGTGTTPTSCIMLRFDGVATQLAGKTVVSASFELAVGEYRNIGGGIPLDIDVHEVLVSWIGRQERPYVGGAMTAVRRGDFDGYGPNDPLLWTVPGAQGDGTDRSADPLFTVTVAHNQTSGHVYSFTGAGLAALVQGWIDTPSSNNGVQLNIAPSMGAASVSYQFLAEEATTENEPAVSPVTRPRLRVTCTD